MTPWTEKEMSSILSAEKTPAISIVVKQERMNMIFTKASMKLRVILKPILFKEKIDEEYNILVFLSLRKGMK
jgi:hypothetical protein